jgi:hypothetical protein
VRSSSGREPRAPTLADLSSFRTVPVPSSPAMTNELVPYPNLVSQCPLFKVLRLSSSSTRARSRRSREPGAYPIHSCPHDCSRCPHTRAVLRAAPQRCPIAVRPPTRGGHIARHPVAHPAHLERRDRALADRFPSRFPHCAPPSGTSPAAVPCTSPPVTIVFQRLSPLLPVPRRRPPARPRGRPLKQRHCAPERSLAPTEQPGFVSACSFSVGRGWSDLHWQHQSLRPDRFAATTIYLRSAHPARAG